MRKTLSKGFLATVSDSTCLLGEDHDEALDQEIHPWAVLSIDEDCQHLERGTLMLFMRQMPNHSIDMSFVGTFGFSIRVREEELVSQE